MKKHFIATAILACGFLLNATFAAAQGGKHELLTPKNSQVLLIDYQPQMLFGVKSHEPQMVVNNVTGLAKAAKVFQVPMILTTVETESFSGPMFSQLSEVYPDTKPIERSSMNTWDSDEVKKLVKENGQKKRNRSRPSAVNELIGAGMIAPRACSP